MLYYFHTRFEIKMYIFKNYLSLEENLKCLCLLPIMSIIKIIQGDANFAVFILWIRWHFAIVAVEIFSLFWQDLYRLIFDCAWHKFINSELTTECSVLSWLTGDGFPATIVTLSTLDLYLWGKMKNKVNYWEWSFLIILERYSCACNSF